MNKFVLRTLLFCSGLICWTVRAEEGYWAPDFYSPGNKTARVYALELTPDGSLYAGGDFPNFANQPGTSGIARWNGETWQGVGGGISLSVRAMLVVGNDLYVGGSFAVAGSVPASNVARWDGVAWHPLGTGVSGVVHALAWHDGALYIGGTFTQAGDALVNNLAKWDGATWHDVGGGVSDPKGATLFGVGVVNALHFVKNNLFVGGSFTSAGTTSAAHIARWDGTNWNALGNTGTDGVNAVVLAIASDSVGNLYVGGLFDTAGGNKIDMIAYWDGTTWSQLGPGLAPNSGTHISDLYYDGSHLFATGYVLGAENVLRWDGAQWTFLPSPTDNALLALAGNGKQLYASGMLSSPSSYNLHGIVRFDGSNWSTMGAGMMPYYKVGGTEPASVTAITPFKNRIIAVGVFGDAKIGAWDGLNWNSMVQPVRIVNASISYFAAVSDNDTLYVSGSPPMIDEKVTGRIAQYDGTNWTALGMGLPGPASALVLRGSELFASHPEGLWRWNGNTWSVIEGLPGSALSLAVDTTNLYAGGLITNAASGSMEGVARWDGDVWRSLGDGLDGPVNSLLVHNRLLFAAGDFRHAGGRPADHLAVWDGSSWDAIDTSHLGPPGTVTEANALSVLPDGTLFVGGAFGTNGLAIIRSNRLAAFPTGDGRIKNCIAPPVLALSFNDGDLYCGGKFRPDNRDNPSLRFANWHVSTPMLIPTATVAKSIGNHSDLRYSITIFNSADRESANSSLSVTIPAGTSFILAENGGDLLDQEIRWLLTPFSAGERRTIKFAVRVNSQASLVALDDYKVLEFADSNLYRGAAVYTTVTPPAISSPLLSLVSFSAAEQATEITLQIDLPQGSPQGLLSIQYSTDLATWLDLASASAPSSTFQFTDRAGSIDGRFYRGISRSD